MEVVFFFATLAYFGPLREPFFLPRVIPQLQRARPRFLYPLTFSIYSWPLPVAPLRKAALRVVRIERGRCSLGSLLDDREHKRQHR